MTEKTTPTDTVIERLDALLATGGWGGARDDTFATALGEIHAYLSIMRRGDNDGWVETAEGEEVSLTKEQIHTLLIVMTMTPVEISEQFKETELLA